MIINQGVIQEFIDQGRLEILESEVPLENVHDISKAFSVERFNVVKVMILRNKYSSKLVACIFTGGSKVDRRALVELDEGGTKAWNYIPNKDLSSVCGYPSGGVAPLGLSASIDLIFVDPRVLKKEFVIFPLGSSMRFGKADPSLFLEDDRTSERVISMG